MTNDEVLQYTSHLIGTRYIGAVKTYIAALTGRERIIGPGEPSSREFDYSRVNVMVDQAGIITEINFG